MTDIEKTLAERGARYGDFTHNAEIAIGLFDAMTDLGGWKNLTSDKKIALINIQQKISRIIAGDPDHTDGWRDIQGYAKLAEDRCKVEVIGVPSPQPDADGWIPWGGGECPVDGGALVSVKFRNYNPSSNDPVPACNWIWHHLGKNGDIMAYKVIKP